MSSKKGFIVSQAMIYAFGLIVVAIIFFWGYKSMKTFSTSSDTSELNHFSLKFTSEMETLSFKKDSVKEFTYLVPQSYEYFCIFDLENENNLNATIMTYYPDLKDYIIDKTANVFLVKKSKIFPIKSDYVFINNYPYYNCKKIFAGTLKFTAKGSIHNNEVATQIIVDTIAKKKLNDTTGLFTPTGTPNQYKSNFDYKLYSTDEFAFISIKQNTIISLPPGKDYISLELTYPDPNSDSETYVEGPKGTTFSNVLPEFLIEGIKPKTGNCDDSGSYDAPGAEFIRCENGFALFKLNGNKFS